MVELLSVGWSVVVYDEGIITASYATGRVDGRNEGGLVGDDEGGDHHQQLLGYAHVRARIRVTRLGQNDVATAVAHELQRHLRKLERGYQ